MAKLTRAGARGAGARPTDGAGATRKADVPLVATDAGTLVVTGAAHVLAVLEEVEDGLLTDVDVIELYLCEGGCFGSPLLSEDHHVAARRWAQGRAALEAAAEYRAAARRR